MNWMKFSKNLLGTVCLAALVTMNAVAEQQASKQPVALASAEVDAQVVPTGCTRGRCTRSCPYCKDVCCPALKEKEVKKHCWKVTPDLVCIPGFRWPWHRCTAESPQCGDDCQRAKPRCGRVRCVNVLEKHEYTCKKCSYEWTVKQVCSGSCSFDSGDCCCPDCGCPGCE